MSLPICMWLWSSWSTLTRRPRRWRRCVCADADPRRSQILDLDALGGHLIAGASRFLSSTATHRASAQCLPTNDALYIRQGIALLWYVLSCAAACVRLMFSYRCVWNTCSSLGALPEETLYFAFFHVTV